MVLTFLITLYGTVALIAAICVCCSAPYYSSKDWWSKNVTAAILWPLVIVRFLMRGLMLFMSEWFKEIIRSKERS